jgi:hypothetical protein
MEIELYAATTLFTFLLWVSSVVFYVVEKKNSTTLIWNSLFTSVCFYLLLQKLYG